MGRVKQVTQSIPTGLIDRRSHLGRAVLGLGLACLFAAFQNLALPVAFTGFNPFRASAVADLAPTQLIRQVSVRILGDQSSGSGVILFHQDDRYIVLTNAHVVADDRIGSHSEPAYAILTADGQSYPGQWLRDIAFPDQDLALVQFNSPRRYPVVQLRRSDRFRIGETVYAAGFPNWRLLSPTRLAETRAEGFQALQVTTGRVEMLLGKPLVQGYQLGYTNEVAAGMSGGPILDRQGQLVGINGGLKYPPQGIVAFTFADGSFPSVALFEQMEALSWGIPVSMIRQALSASRFDPITWTPE